MNRMIAVVGMCGSGKSIACDYFEKNGYQKVYFGGVTIEKLKKANLDITPDNEKMMREKLRKDYGMGAYAKLLLPKITELAINNDIILDGLYSWEELLILKDKFNNLEVLAIIVDKKIRYERLNNRTIRPFTKEEAIKRDISEIENLNKAGPIAYADYYIDNNGNLEDYEKQLEKILKRC